MTKQTTKRNTKRVASAANNAKRAAASATNETSKRAASAAATTLSAAAIVRKHFSKHYDTAQRMKTARALLRAHNIKRDEKSIVEFFKAHIAKRASA